ncbi:hypothetical protein EDD29_3760 [Actinocorallia herbida]|uniref:Novel STAND NTPase 1 domain-containing protein n=1 Tax=Actinocorallia herbida TaxID=58109 RepID=A0A3N1CY18_9ACTN|nr:ATP-binding protein [Actinocorallia herbida]ROO86197.1 hypothetical protein EDD29_3760 [Actinocorallia herbida]
MRHPQPFPGGRPFTEEDAPLFFGRRRQADALAEAWRTHRLTVLSGPPGCGKTSLIRAGAQAALRDAGEDVLPLGGVSYGSAFPSAALPEHNVIILALLSAWLEADPATLAGRSLVPFFRQRPRRSDAIRSRKPFFAAIDHGEELFVGRAVREWNRLDFRDQIIELLADQPDLRLLISVRAEQSGLVDGLFDGLAPAHVELAGLDPEAALEALVRPVEAVGGSFAQGAAESLIAELTAGGEVDPGRLQTVARALWREHPDFRPIAGPFPVATWLSRFETPAEQTPDEHLTAAEAALAVGDWPAARRHAELALGASSSLRVKARSEAVLGNTAWGESDADDAEAHYQTAASLYEAGQDSYAVGRLLAAIGQLRLFRGRLEDGIEQLRAAAARMPGDPVVQTELARALWYLGEGRGAIALLTNLLRADADRPLVLRARGEILADLGQAENALRDFDRAGRDLWPTARAARALALATMSDFAAARAEIGSALDDAPDNASVLLYAARVETLSGRANAAADLARRAVQASRPELPPHQREIALSLLGE